MKNMLKYSNFIFVISAPSGGGKTSIVDKILQRQSDFQLSISATSRQPRGGEKNGGEYYFFSKEEFEKKIKNNEFVEYAEVHGNYYGTLKKEVERILNGGNNVILNIDWQGAKNVSKLFSKEQVLKIFVLPPSFAELEKRLRNRQIDSEEVIQKRLTGAKNEVIHHNEFDYIIINDNLDDAVKQVESLIIAKKLSNTDKHVLQKLVEEF